jgi:diguanylate cyclase (GGDEF)-like protein
MNDTLSRFTQPVPDGPAAPGQDPLAGDSLRRHLQQIIEEGLLTPLFQPIIDMQQGEIVGYEGLVRGPSDSPLHSPFSLFRAAHLHGLSTQVELLCRQVVLAQFAAQALPGKLFLNISPGLLINGEGLGDKARAHLLACGVAPERIIIELTENQPAFDYGLLRKAVAHYRAQGFCIAIDDLGEGFSSLRLWSELRPEYVKLDKHFIQGINHDPVKLHFVRSIQEIARNSAAAIVAEGIETPSELRAVRGLRIAFGQGYLIGRPQARPEPALPAELAQALGHADGAARDDAPPIPGNATAGRLLRPVEPVAPDTPNEKVFELFKGAPELQSVPVVVNGIPLGIINRYTTIERFAHRYWRDLYGRRPCTALIDFEPIVVDKTVGIQELSSIMVSADQRQLTNGFILTDAGKYLGVGTGHDLMAEITRLQIHAARYANPLTQLPGNVPISEHIEYLLGVGAAFAACYCDLDHFKPFNDAYGYRKGDELIQRLGSKLAAHCDPLRDFLGHIGGDDFIILFRSKDWEARCQAILDSFGPAIADLFHEADRERGGYLTEDRQGNQTFCPLVSLSLGVVIVEADDEASQHQISTSIAEAKKQAKKIPGNSMFVERRRIGAPPQQQSKLPF